MLVAVFHHDLVEPVAQPATAQRLPEGQRLLGRAGGGQHNPGARAHSSGQRQELGQRVGEVPFVFARPVTRGLAREGLGLPVGGCVGQLALPVAQVARAQCGQGLHQLGTEAARRVALWAQRDVVHQNLALVGTEREHQRADRAVDVAIARVECQVDGLPCWPKHHRAVHPGRLP